MDALTPAYARTPIEFSDRGSVPTVSVSVAGAGDQRTTLDVTSRLTNQGDEAAGGLTMVVVVRQAESNVVADEASTEVGRIRAGRTARVGTTVEVPAGYNYYVDVELYRDGVLIDAAQGVANLDPKKQVEADTVEKDVQFNVSEFERSGSGGDRGRPAGSPTEVSTPGFGPAVVLVALLAAAVIVLTRRRR
jgi:PGF-CTERM protein